MKNAKDFRPAELCIVQCTATCPKLTILPPDDWDHDDDHDDGHDGDGHDGDYDHVDHDHHNQHNLK